MSRSKKIFLVVACVFLLLLGYAAFDIGSRTTFPGSGPQAPERLREPATEPDSLSTDSARKEKLK